MIGTPATFQSLVEGFFADWLPNARNASPNTVSAYRYTFTLLLEWYRSAMGIAPDSVSMSDFTAVGVGDYLTHLATVRDCAPSTVNNRLAAVKSFCEYASLRCPEHLAELSAIRRLPQRKVKTAEVDYLTPEEVGWVLEGCGTPGSRLLLLMLYNTGARVSEVVGISVDDVEVGDGGRCRITVLGKGRKQRTLPLWKDVSDELRAYIDAKGLNAEDYLFAGRSVGHLTRSGARSRIDSAVARACEKHPSLTGKHVTPHTFRHSTAMAMLAAGVDIATVAIWLGHENVNTTHKYVVSNMKLKEEALAKVRRDWQAVPRKPYRAEGDVLAFLRSL